MPDQTENPPINVSHLRDCLGLMVQHVALTDNPIIIRRYKEEAVIMVPLWEWRWLKGLEAKVRAGEPILPSLEDEDGH